MKGLVNIPVSIFCKPCKYCGARPVIALTDKAEYIVKCPNNNAHYQTLAGLIDIEDWNFHNSALLDSK